MKVRVGVGLGVVAPPETYPGVLDLLEQLGIDSVWFPESIATPLLDPQIGLAFAAGRTRTLKLGTGVTVLPGRSPVHLAKELASLALLAPGRILPAFGLQPSRPQERAAYPVPPGRRGEVLEEALVLVRRLLAQEVVDADGVYFPLGPVSVSPRPARPLDLWLGGSGPKALERVGRLADGWLASLVTPQQAGAAVDTIAAAAAAAGRTMDPEHYGINIPVAFGPLPAATRAHLAGLGQGPEGIVAQGWSGAGELIRAYLDVGLSKFVVRPAGPPPSWAEFCQGVATHLSPLTT